MPGDGIKAERTALAAVVQTLGCGATCGLVFGVMTEGLGGALGFALLGLVTGLPVSLIAASIVREARIEALWFASLLMLPVAAAAAIVVRWDEGGVGGALAVLSMPTAFMVLCAVGAGKFPVRRTIDRSKCASCGYDLGGLAGGVCPECGKERPHDA